MTRTGYDSKLTVVIILCKFYIQINCIIDKFSNTDHQLVIGLISFPTFVLTIVIMCSKVVNFYYLYYSYFANYFKCRFKADMKTNINMI